MVDVLVTVGVPLIAPVEVSKESPVGSDGEIDQEVTAPPLDVGVTVVIVVPLVSDNELGCKILKKAQHRLLRLLSKRYRYRLC